ncbi:hypothetical protein DFH07DRAFT_870303 [Mycena maculata]|uniref:CxC2-like cysteine cluster KDZ transposase-associated domain-containing protein n=1 Tax=Mycena maculata TaxID=230809 RepID=A0AAD7IET4_9AGAR|nr:hypothetical protein DFH07DRAFT_870303 [Mycena maculata]
MFTHQPHIAEVVSVSQDGQRANTSSEVVRTTATVPDYYQDDAATNAALESADFSYDLGDDSLIPESYEPEDDGIAMTGRKKRYENSVSTFVFCGITSLRELGLKIQLGHPPGYSCPTSHAGHEEFVVIDITGIHFIAVAFCECDSRVLHWQQAMRVQWWPATVKDPRTCATFAVIRLFQIMNCLGKVSAHDFLRSLELLTNNNGLNALPDRRRAFREIVRQYRMTVMLERGGRGHDPAGVEGTAQGELALRCRSCPQHGRNLPDGWDRIDWSAMPEDLRYKYFLFLAQDCNFRLINRNVGSAAKDPILGDGWGYFVNHEKYTAFLRDHVTEEEVSSCSGFQAMFLANRKRVKGLRTTGVGGVTCAQHNMWRPNGIGDLQLGERYCNMDFILASAVLRDVIYYLVLSYDIACQYGKKFWERMGGLPPEFQLFIETLRIWFKVPNFHLPLHKPPCHSPYSFHYMWGAGRTHGETVEQNWEFTNGAVASTKMMGLGMRASTLEDLLAFHNWRRTVAWRTIFRTRMAENVKEGQIHRDAFEAFDAALQEQAGEMVTKWKEWVHQWEARQHTDNSESPFETTEKGLTMKEIWVRLAKEELIRSGEGVEVEREDTPTTFILMGLEIEESQRQLAIGVKANATPTELQTINILKRRTTLVKRIRGFRKMQRTYMPNIRRFLTTAQRAQWDTETERDAEAIRLFMPSDITEATKRDSACADCRKSRGTCGRALRGGLRTRTMTNRFRLRNATGQRALTRGQGILRQINMKIHKAKLRYRYARNALSRLRGHGAWERDLQVLLDSDVRALNERALTEEEAAQRGTVHDLRDVEEGGVGSYGVVALGEGRRTLSWIWYTTKAGEPTEGDLVEALRVEWCKAYARMQRWHEDVVLVEEEMRCTIAYGYWASAEWEQRAGGRTGTVDSALEEGLVAYAKEQSWREVETCRRLERNWAPIRERGRAYLARETVSSGEIRIPITDEDGRDPDEEEGAPDYEDEEDDEVLD